MKLHINTLKKQATRWLFANALLLLVNNVGAQVNPKDSAVFIPMIAISGGANMPGSDLAKRFGLNANVGADFWIKNKKGWMYGVECHYLFGRAVKETAILDSIMTKPNSDGNKYVISKDGKLTNPRLWERGAETHLQVGKLLVNAGPNPNCGFFAMVGIGMLYHKIRIEDIGNNSPQLSKEFRKGYDRLTYGISTSQMIGYLYMHDKKYFNFFVGLEAIEGFTKNRRGYNYDTRSYDTQNRLDNLFGFKAGLIIPLYKKVPNEFYYY